MTPGTSPADAALVRTHVTLRLRANRIWRIATHWGATVVNNRWKGFKAMNQRIDEERVVHRLVCSHDSKNAGIMLAVGMQR